MHFSVHYDTPPHARPFRLACLSIPAGICLYMCLLLSSSILSSGDQGFAPCWSRGGGFSFQETVGVACTCNIVHHRLMFNCEQFESCCVSRCLQLSFSSAQLCRLRILVQDRGANCSDSSRHGKDFKKYLRMAGVLWQCGAAAESKLLRPRIHRGIVVALSAADPAASAMQLARSSAAWRRTGTLRPLLSANLIKLMIAYVNNQADDPCSDGGCKSFSQIQAVVSAVAKFRWQMHCKSVLSCFDEARCCA